MAITQQEALQKLNNLSFSIKDAMKSMNGRYDVLGEEIDYNKDPDGRFLRGEIRWMLEKLDDVVRQLAYLDRPIKAEGTLRLMSNGRYSLITSTGEEALECTSGTGIEVLLYEDDEDDATWLATRVESTQGGYYLWNASKHPMESMRARVR